MPLKPIACGSNTKIYKQGKLVKKVFLDPNDNKFEQEKEIYSLLVNKVRHLIRYESFNDDDSKKKYILMDYYPYTLEEVITTNRLEKPAHKAKVIQQLLEFISDCHRVGVSHNDFKAKNILVDAHYNIYVSDFDLSSSGDDMDMYADHEKLMILMLQIKNNRKYVDMLNAMEDL